ncbi:MAG: GNAT family N-acetyltransferase [Desulfobacula sp.]|nr:GNAT family N-acetyltransferase [Desulfobacula sp.]
MSEWKFEKAKNSFGKYKKNWQKLCVDVLGFNHPLMHVDYIEPLLKQFASEDILLALKGEAGEEGMVLLNQRNWGVWDSFVPNTGPFCFSLIKTLDEGTANSSIESLMKTLPGISVMVCFNKLDPDHLGVKIDMHKKHIEKIEYMDTVNIPVDRSFENYWQKRSKNLKRSITKKRNRIEKNGIKMEWTELTLEKEIKEGLETYEKLETLGWKGKINTAITLDNPSGLFYKEMLSRFSKRKKASIFQLLFNDKVVASALTIQGGSMLIILKIAYDEEMKDYSPGLMMMYELHKRAFEIPGIKFIEHYGRVKQTAKQLSVNIRTIYHINYFRNSYIHGIVNGLRTIKKLIN